jgi:hypothetical protein
MTYTEHLIQRIDTALAEDALEEKWSRNILAKLAAAGIGAAALGGGMAHAQDVQRAQPVAPHAELAQRAQPASLDDTVAPADEPVVQWILQTHPAFSREDAVRYFNREPEFSRQHYQEYQQHLQRRRELEAEQQTKAAASQAAIPDEDEVRDAVRHALARYLGVSPDSFASIPMSAYGGVRPTGRSIGDEGEWQANFDSFGQSVFTRGHGSTVTFMAGKFAGNEVWYNPGAKAPSGGGADVEGPRRAGQWQAAPAATPTPEESRVKEEPTPTPTPEPTPEAIPTPMVRRAEPVVPRPEPAAPTPISVPRAKALAPADSIGNSFIQKMGGQSYAKKAQASLGGLVVRDIKRSQDGKTFSATVYVGEHYYHVWGPADTFTVTNIKKMM